MGLTAGIVGLPNVGKSTLFNAITKAGALAANYPFATIDPNVGVVEVPDVRLDKLTELVQPKKTIPTIFEFTDIAGIVKGSSKGEGLGNKFLSHIREVDAIVQVVRAFDDENVTHVDGAVDPIRDIETINLELIFADLEVVEKRLPKIEKKAVMKVDQDSVQEYAVLKTIHETLLNNQPIRTMSFSAGELRTIKPFNFLTQKPMLYVANIDENDIADYADNPYVKQIEEFARTDNADMVVISAKIEAELSELEADEKAMFLEELGVVESGLDQLVKHSYSLLGLETFFTAGPKEVRAWTFKKGSKAPTCAGVIHSDFEKGFIRAETIKYVDFIEYHGEHGAKEAGKMRLEGKEYVVHDGDVMHFLFNV
ncbi:redox-regulated ATPase YchF [Candidatus Xianfuyuplasma coldseepsis]|uniref:Ribosome-binding ATPase YchF n=1 Tax=Candidatus Xianfuyuplasma coldseepsis TaxID=2782163 RepID=A0A7L7KTR2_9MOLU|nr:redox-regulated ATPase YchF [Xianfuyuplasma coldseepsis]QMS85384.1 redox-regulated ATPase YchF [Xianfuyuplasma coldseepsis]